VAESAATSANLHTRHLAGLPLLRPPATTPSIQGRPCLSTLSRLLHGGGGPPTGVRAAGSGRCSSIAPRRATLASRRQRHGVLPSVAHQSGQGRPEERREEHSKAEEWMWIDVVRTEEWWGLGKEVLIFSFGAWAGKGHVLSVDCWHRFVQHFDGWYM
jgi:hypothetical protein